jgi:hypothetical protein
VDSLELCDALLYGARLVRRGAPRWLKKKIEEDSIQSEQIYSSHESDKVSG